MRRLLWREWALIALAVTVSGILLTSSPVKPPRKKSLDETWADIRYENSGNLVDELDGIEINKIYKVKGPTGVTAFVTIAQIDAGWRKVVVIVGETEKVGGDLSGKAYDPDMTVRIDIDQLSERIKAAAE